MDETGRRSAFLQIITANHSYHVPFNFSEFSASRHGLAIHLGENCHEPGPCLRQKEACLEVTIARREQAQPLWAPRQGHMVRSIHEAPCCRFSVGKKKLLDFISNKVSFEYARED